LGMGVAAENGGLAMPSSAYFRRQADICLRLSLIASDDAVAGRLATMARDYIATSEALDREAGGGPDSEADAEALPDPILGRRVPGTSEPSPES